MKNEKIIPKDNESKVEELTKKLKTSFEKTIAELGLKGASSITFQNFWGLLRHLTDVNKDDLEAYKNLTGVAPATLIVSLLEEGGINTDELAKLVRGVTRNRAAPTKAEERSSRLEGDGTSTNELAKLMQDGTRNRATTTKAEKRSYPHLTEFLKDKPNIKRVLTRKLELHFQTYHMEPLSYTNIRNLQVWFNAAMETNREEPLKFTDVLALLKIFEAEEQHPSLQSFSNSIASLKADHAANKSS